MAGKKDSSGVFTKEIDGKTAIFKASEDKKEEIFQQMLQKRLKYVERTTKLERELREKSAKAAATYEENMYKKLNARKRFEHDQAVAKEAEATIKAKKDELNAIAKKEASYKAQLELLEEKKKEATDKRAEGKIEKQIANIKDKLTDLTEESDQIKSESKTIQKHLDAYNKNKGTLLGPVGRIKDKLETKSAQLTKQGNSALDNRADKALKVRKLEEAHLKKIQKLQKERAKAEESGDKKELANIDALIAAEEEQFQNSEKYAKAKQELEEATWDTAKVAAKEFANDTKKALLANAMNLANAATQSIDNTINTMYGSQGRMNAHLQGLTDDFADHVDKVSANIGLSGVVSQKSVVAKMTELIDSGVAYNIELRAFLAETSQNIASTFNALDETLLRIVRIQQADSTAARLGMEASLTRLFNQTFKDTSYLTKDIFDSVTSAIVDATSQMTRDQSLEFEYALQKWLGSLYSVGMSSEGISTIAQGINYLATGNVSALSGNESLQTLLAMSASRTNKSYAELLTGNMTGEDTNNLLKAMVEYLAEIASSQENFVTKSAYAELFGMSITDLSSFATLNNSSIEKLYQQTQNYNSLMTETGSQLTNMWKRLNVSQIVDTVIDNALTSSATNIGGSLPGYGLWKALNIVEGATGGVKIPGVLAAGFGISSDIDILQVAKAGIAGLSLLGSLVEGLGSSSLFGTFDMNQWGYEEYNQRGGAITGITGGFTSGTSFSASMGVGSSSADDMKTTSLQDTTDEAMESSGVTSEEVEQGKDVQNRMLDTLLSIEQLLDPKRVFYTGIAGVVSNMQVGAVSDLSNSIVANNASSTFLVSETLSADAAEKGQQVENLIHAIKGDPEVKDMSTIIADAVATAVTQALSKISDNSSSNPLYVTQTPGGY